MYIRNNSKGWKYGKYRDTGNRYKATSRGFE